MHFAFTIEFCIGKLNRGRKNCHAFIDINTSLYLTFSVRHAILVFLQAGIGNTYNSWNPLSGAQPGPAGFTSRINSIVEGNEPFMRH